jgi:2-aminoethylphosphonate dioxygenase
MRVFWLCSLLIYALKGGAMENDERVPLDPPSSISEWEKHRTFFQENGYLWIKNFFSKEQSLLLQNWADEINESAQFLMQMAQSTGVKLQKIAKDIPGALIVVPEARDPNLVCRTEDNLTCYPELLSFVEGTLTAYLGKLFDEPYVIFKDKINFKWPGGGAFTPHQDFPAYELFGPREHVTAMISIDPATLENGCLQVAKNWRASFKGDPSIDQEQLAIGRAIIPYIEGGKNHGSIQPNYAEKFSWLQLETSPGDLVLISSFVPHYSEPNQSNKPRRAMFLTHNRLIEGEHREAYYYTKRNDPDNPVFHFATPTQARTK